MFSSFFALVSELPSRLGPLAAFANRRRRNRNQNGRTAPEDLLEFCGFHAGNATTRGPLNYADYVNAITVGGGSTTCGEETDQTSLEGGTAYHQHNSNHFNMCAEVNSFSGEVGGKPRCRFCLQEDDVAEEDEVFFAGSSRDAAIVHADRNALPVVASSSSSSSAAAAPADPPPTSQQPWISPGKMVAPCGCTGSSKYVHFECLRAWQQTLLLQLHTRSQSGSATGDQEVRHVKCSLCLQNFKPEFAPVSRSEFLTGLCGVREEDFSPGTLLLHEKERMRARLEALPFMLRVFVELKHQHFRNSCYLLVDESPKNPLNRGTNVDDETSTRPAAQAPSSVVHSQSASSEDDARKLVGVNLVRPISLSYDEWNTRFYCLRDLIRARPDVRVFTLAGGPCQPRKAQVLAVLKMEASAEPGASGSLDLRQTEDEVHRPGNGGEAEQGAASWSFLQREIAKRCGLGGGDDRGRKTGDAQWGKTMPLPGTPSSEPIRVPAAEGGEAAAKLRVLAVDAGEEVATSSDDGISHDQAAKELAEDPHSSRARVLVFCDDFDVFLGNDSLRERLCGYFALVLGQAEWGSTQLLAEFCKRNWAKSNSHSEVEKSFVFSARLFAKLPAKLYADLETNWLDAEGGFRFASENPMSRAVDEQQRRETQTLAARVAAPDDGGTNLEEGRRGAEDRGEQEQNLRAGAAREGEQGQPPEPDARAGRGAEAGSSEERADVVRMARHVEQQIRFRANEDGA
mmetsp:Transcript_28693/g.72655  ORF Transcript_28693/g.72655 Transcript_28693/m.72655 type:complete len:741 (+) Transcript_28693:360-2582(+)